MPISSRGAQEPHQSRFVWIAILLAFLLAGEPLSAAEDSARQPGLRGVLPDSVPVELTGAIGALPESWKAWGSALNYELSTLYEKPDADGSAQRQAISALRRRIASARQHIGDPQYRSILNVLVSIAGGLQRRLDVAEAGLDLLDRSPDQRQNLKDLLAAIEDYESGHSTASAAAIRKAYAAAQPGATDGSDKLSVALRKHYFNYNLRVVAGEGFLNKMFDQSRTEMGPVRDFILGADVYGNQTTQTNVSLKLIPSNGNAQFDVVANGAVASSTLGYTDQATIATSGNHYFTAAKRVLFNGETFSIWPARISVNANNTTTDAETNINFPILSGIARGIAMSRAEEMRPESEAIAASRVQDKVLPAFNSQVDREFRDLNPKLSARWQALRELKLYPDAKTWSTTNSDLKVATRLMGAQDLGGSEPSPAMYLGRGVTVVVHDTLMDRFADSLDFAGKSLTDDEIKSQIEGQLAKLLGRDVKFPNDKAPASDESRIKTIVFDKTDPLRMRADDGTLVLTIRAGFQQEDKEDIPTQIITLPLKFTVNVQNVVIEPGDISIEAAEKPASPATQLARAGVIRKKLDAAFPRREIQRARRVQSKNRTVVTAVTRIRALDGWLSITFE